jgi:hypothetical protein
MRVMRKVLVVLSLAAAVLALVALGVAPAQAATRHPSKREVGQLNHFLSAFAEQHVTSFTRSAGPSNLLLVHFGVWYTFEKNFDAVVIDDESYGYIDSAIVDTVDQRYFGRAATARESYPSVDIAYAEGFYQFMPATGGLVHRAKLTRAASSDGRIWTVYLLDQSRPEWVMTGGGWTTEARCRATVEDTGTAQKHHFVLLAWKRQ